LLLYSHPIFAQWILSWDVAVVDSVADTLSVELTLPCPSCGDISCYMHNEFKLWVSPCPLYESCTEDTYYLDRITGPNADIRISLKFLVGVSYSIGGDYQYCGAHGTTREGYPCAIFCCIHPEIAIRSYPDDFVATTATTWGGIKALYKDK
jgi:hypothetical protein